MRRSRVQVMVLTALLAAGAFMLPVTASQAGSVLCPAGTACIYVDPGFIGLIAYRQGGQGVQDVAPHEDNKTSSWENKSSQNAAWYDQAGGGGNCFRMDMGTEVSSIRWPSYDKLTSWKTNGTCP